MKRILCSLLFFSFFSVQTIYAWNFVGHMVVADVAYQNLKPDVRRKVDALVGYFQKEYPQMKTFVDIAYWPDTIRQQKIEAFNHWHYIDNPFSQDGTPLKNIVDTDNCVWALKSIKGVTKNQNANSFERARFLAFFIHIVGDLHQPLHTVSRISMNNPDGDQGGNLFNLRVGNKRVKLHQLWDDGLGIFDGDATDAHAREISTKIMGLYPAAYFGDKISDLDPNHWAEEGMKNAKDYVYNTPEDKQVSSQYIAQGQQLVQQEAALAGYRAAALLNQMLG